MCCVILPTTKVAFFIFVNIQKVTNALNFLTNPICKIYLIYFSYRVAIFCQLGSTLINLGFYETLVQELKFEGKSEYKNFLRMTPHNVNEILVLIHDDITKPNTNVHDSVPANIKLASTIRFLTTGDARFC